MRIGCGLRLTLQHRITESQNGRGWKRSLWVTQPNPLPKQSHLQQAVEDLVQAGLEYLQRRTLSPALRVVHARPRVLPVLAGSGDGSARGDPGFVRPRCPRATDQSEHPRSGTCCSAWGCRRREPPRPGVRGVLGPALLEADAWREVAEISFSWQVQETCPVWAVKAPTQKSFRRPSLWERRFGSRMRCWAPPGSDFLRPTMLCRGNPAAGQRDEGSKTPLCQPSGSSVVLGVAW